MLHCECSSFPENNTELYKSLFVEKVLFGDVDIDGGKGLWKQISDSSAFFFFLLIKTN